MDSNDLNLIKYYINVTNTALAQGGSGISLIPRKTIVNAMASGTWVAFRIADGQEVADQAYVTRFIDGQFTPVKKANRGKKVDSEYVLQRAFLEEVQSRSSEFIENPAKLDWGWANA